MTVPSGRGGPNPALIQGPLGGTQKMTVVNESALTVDIKKAVKFFRKPTAAWECKNAAFCASERKNGFSS